jgi:RNA recognition motif-containing protein
MNIFVAKLNFSTTSDGLRAAFEQYGDVKSASVIIDKMTNKSKGFGFVEMEDDSEAQSAINALNDSDLDGRNIVVSKAQPREDRNNGGGGGGGYNRNRY